jgi:hypothetical protein
VRGNGCRVPPAEGTAGKALCSSGVYVWDPLLWSVAAGCLIAAIPMTLQRRSLRPMALAWLGGVALGVLSIVLIRIVDAARSGV